MSQLLVKGTSQESVNPAVKGTTVGALGFCDSPLQALSLFFPLVLVQGVRSFPTSCKERPTFAQAMGLTNAAFPPLEAPVLPDAGPRLTLSRDTGDNVLGSKHSAQNLLSRGPPLPGLGGQCGHCQGATGPQARVGGLEMSPVQLMERRGFKSTEGSTTCLLSQCLVSAPTAVWSVQHLSQEAHLPGLSHLEGRQHQLRLLRPTKSFRPSQPPRSQPAGHFFPGFDLANVCAGK